MNDYSKKIKDKLDIVTMSREDFDTLCKDRLDFGFDSIYFRYAEVCDELAAYIARANGSSPIDERRHMSGRKMHFYYALEQLLQAHVQEEDK